MLEGEKMEKKIRKKTRIKNKNELETDQIYEGNFDISDLYPNNKNHIKINAV